MKLDGSGPKQKPGRKPTKQPKVYVMPGFDAAGNIVNATRLGRGKPSEAVLEHRRVVTLPIGETYDYNKHGLGERDPADDVALADFRAARKAREDAAKAAKEAAKAASAPAAAPANPVSAEVTILATNTETVTV